jgi:hypothetical protein
VISHLKCDINQSRTFQSRAPSVEDLEVMAAMHLDLVIAGLGSADSRNGCKTFQPTG